MKNNLLANLALSGGKDSTAMALLAIENNIDAKYVFADTGHEHRLTYEYISYLKNRLGIEIDVVKADFSDQIRKKRKTVKTKWVKEGFISQSEANDIAKLLKPTNVPFLDLCLWKGRFPSTRARFCSSELKHEPLDQYIIKLIKEGHKVESWQGIRADESPARKNLPIRERSEIYDIYRPILKWSVDDVFKIHKKHNLKPNPLYLKGMSRVGCMPCIHARKSEIFEIGKRFPEELRRVAEWELIVSKVCKRGTSTFFHSSTDPTIATKDNRRISVNSHGIDKIYEWSKTSRGGRQYQLDFHENKMCHSMYGLCE